MEEDQVTKLIFKKWFGLWGGSGLMGVLHVIQLLTLCCQ